MSYRYRVRTKRVYLVIPLPLPAQFSALMQRLGEASGDTCGDEWADIYLDGLGQRLDEIVAETIGELGLAHLADTVTPARLAAECISAALGPYGMFQDEQIETAEELEEAVIDWIREMPQNQEAEALFRRAVTMAGPPHYREARELCARACKSWGIEPDEDLLDED